MATGTSKLLEQFQLKAGLNRCESFRLEKEMPEGCKPMSDMTEWIVIDCSVASATRTKRHQIQPTEDKFKIKEMVSMQLIVDLRNFLPQDVVDGLVAFG